MLSAPGPSRMSTQQVESGSPPAHSLPSETCGFAMPPRRSKGELLVFLPARWVGRPQPTPGLVHTLTYTSATSALPSKERLIKMARGDRPF